jgi:hypothetical protein
MPGTTIGKSFNHGFAGSYARQPDMIIATRPNVDTNQIKFGRPVMQETAGGVTGVVNVTAGFTADRFIGVAGREVKSALNYAAQELGAGGVYAPDEAVSVFQRGSISVICSAGNPALGSQVFVRTVAAAGKNIGDFEAVADGTNSVRITNAQWGGSADANGVAELVLLTRANA